MFRLVMRSTKFGIQYILILKKLYNPCLRSKYPRVMNVPVDIKYILLS